MRTVKLCGWRPCSGVIVDSCPFYPRLYCTARCAGKEKARVARERQYGSPDSYRPCKLPGCQILIDNSTHQNQVFCSLAHKVEHKNIRLREKRAAHREATREAREHARDVKRLERAVARLPKPKPAPKTLGDLLVPPAKLGRKPKVKDKPPAPQPGCIGCKHAKPNPEAIDGLECGREVYRTCNPHGIGGPKLKEV